MRSQTRAHELALPTPGPDRCVAGKRARRLISLVAGLASDPFAIYYFQRFSVYALPANLITAPIMSFLVAPAAGAAAVLGPFGLADPALELMASALDLVAAIGATFGGRPEALRALPAPPVEAFLLCVFAMLWACLWRGALRWAALLPFAASVALYAAAPRPIAVFDADLRAVFVRAPAPTTAGRSSPSPRSAYAAIGWVRSWAYRPPNLARPSRNMQPQRLRVRRRWSERVDCGARRGGLFIGRVRGAIVISTLAA